MNPAQIRAMAAQWTRDLDAYEDSSSHAGQQDNLGGDGVVANDLHQQIMNLRPSLQVLSQMDGPPKGFYLIGHRDARHAAAELVCASAATTGDRVHFAYTEALAENARLREALAEILRQPQETMSDGKALAAMARIARAALKGPQ